MTTSIVPILHHQNPCIHVEENPERRRLELVELLDSLASSGKDTEDVEADLQVDISIQQGL